MTFQLHCASLGIELLRDDVKFIKHQLLQIPQQLHRSTLEQYAITWLDAMAQCDIVYRKQNLGRRAANTYLRELP